MPPQFAFKAEEKVLCFHGPLLYEAKVLKSQNRVGTSKDEDPGLKAPKTPHFFVHYKGWKRTWDEWVPEIRMRKYNDENLRLAKEMKLEALTAQKKASTSSGTHVGSGNAGIGEAGAGGAEFLDDQEKGSGSVGRGHKRGRESGAGPGFSSSLTGLTPGGLTGGLTGGTGIGVGSSGIWDATRIHKPDLKLSIPDLLKARLVDDWEKITKIGELVPLPRSPNVSQILIDYRVGVPSKRPGSAEADLFDEFMDGVKLYFDKCLGTMLLYKFERLQYANVRKEKGDEAHMSELYGAEHLLRLFVSMPELVGATGMDSQSTAELRIHLQDLLGYLAKNEETLFVKQYDVVAPSYSRILNNPYA